MTGSIPIKVLVVDDDEVMVKFIGDILAEAGYGVESAYGGIEGCRKARALKPDLVILDLVMPDMHGYEVCESLRGNKDLAGMKVLISSGKSYPVDQRASKLVGADSFIHKPYSSDQLLEAVRGLVGGP